MSSQYQGDVMENLFDEGPEGQAHFDEDGFDEDGFEAEGFDEEGFDEEGFDEDGFDEEGFDEDGFDEDAPDHGDAMEMAVADALDAEDADEFFGKLFKKIKSAVPSIKNVLGTVGKVAGAIPLPMTQAIGGIANTIGGMLADEADEGDAFDSMVDFAEEEDALDAAAPVIAGLALRKAAPHLRNAPVATRLQAVKAATKVVRQLAHRHGTAAVAAVPGIVHTAKRHLAARRLPASQLPGLIRKVAAHAHRNPRVLHRHVRHGRALIGSAGHPHHRSHGGIRRHRAGGGTGHGGMGYGGAGYGGAGYGGAVGRGRRRSRGLRASGGIGGAPGSVGSYGSVGGGAPRCAHCGRAQRLRFNGPIQLIIKPL